MVKFLTEAIETTKKAMQQRQWCREQGVPIYDNNEELLMKFFPKIRNFSEELEARIKRSSGEQVSEEPVRSLFDMTDAKKTIVPSAYGVRIARALQGLGLSSVPTQADLGILVDLCRDYGDAYSAYDIAEYFGDRDAELAEQALALCEELKPGAFDVEAVRSGLLHGSGGGTN